MKKTRLLATLGSAEIDAAIQAVIQVYEDAFPEQVAACYIEGSYADQTSLPTSDIDLFLVFRGRFADKAAHVGQTWESQQQSPYDIDISVVDEESLRNGVHPSVKLGGQLIYGQDVCSLYPLVPIDDWMRERMHAAYNLLINVYGRDKPVQLPLVFPAPEDEFYGYMNRTIQLTDGREVPCT
jgi:predicted nucleotidyltransferase